MGGGLAAPPVCGAANLYRGIAEAHRGALVSLEGFRMHGLGAEMFLNCRRCKEHNSGPARAGAPHLDS